jgi:ligand-binding SRPBCC domain-containing protein
MEHTYKTEILLPKPINEVFAFFSDAGNLQRITPPTLHFKILTPLPITMREGALIDYELRLMGIPFRWRTRINKWDPPHQFADEQLKGPYALWYHTHTFTPVDGGTLMRDVVRYRLPLGLLGLPGLPLVRMQIKQIFDYRQAVISQIVGQSPPGSVAIVP